MGSNKKRRGGFSLLEMLIYISIFGAVVLVIGSAFVMIFENRDSGAVRFEVVQNLRFASEKIRQLIYDASSFSVYGSCPLNTLEVTVGGVTTTVSVVNGALTLVSVGVADNLTSNLVTATTSESCLFTKIVNPSPASPSLQFRLMINYNDNGNLDLRFSDSFHTTVSQR